MSFYGTDYPAPPEFDPTMTDAGAHLLDEVADMLKRFVAFPSEHALVATVLWIAHTHALEAFETTPRLAFLSPEPGSGKTRALEILEILACRPLLTVNVTPAYLFRKVGDEAGPPTLLYDEIDTVFGPKAKDNEDIRGMLNAGYRRGATAGRCVIKGKGVEVEELPAFAACALAGLDDLPDTIMTRSVVIRMRRRAPHEKVQPFRRRVHEQPGHELRDRLSNWLRSVWSQLDGAWPDLPDQIVDRDADVWEPLITIADAAGGTWPERARVSAVSLVSDARAKAGGLGVQLLADLRTIFGDEDALTTDVILTRLHELEDAPWDDLRGKPLAARGLAFRLGKYEVKPRQLKAYNRKGYTRADLLDQWVRYLPEPDGSAGVVSPPPQGQPYRIPPPVYEVQKTDTPCLFPQEGETSETSETKPVVPTWPTNLPPPPDDPYEDRRCHCGSLIDDERIAHGGTECDECERGAA